MDIKYFTDLDELVEELEKMERECNDIDSCDECKYKNICKTYCGKLPKVKFKFV